MTWVLSREVIVGLAVLGGLASVAAIVLQARRSVDPQRIRNVNRLAYAIMAISVALFITRGLYGA